MIPCHGCCQHQQSLDPNIEPAFIHKELTRVGAQISHLIAVQAGLLRRRNQHHSPIYTLPPELLTTIFLLACTSGRDSWDEFGTTAPQVLVLSFVSSGWRQAVLQTPSLWNTVALEVRGHTSGTKAALLQHHLIYAKNLDMSLDLILGRYDDAQQNQIFNILFAPENTQKVTTLRVKHMPVEWSAKLSQLPRLHTLVLEHLRDKDNTQVVLDLPTQPLHKIFLSNLFTYSNDPHWGPIHLPSSVQELLTYSVTPCVLLEFLRQCPNLIKVTNLASSNDTDSSFFTTPLTLGYLETLVWPAGKFLDDISVQNFTLPALKHLRLNQGLSDIPAPVITFCCQLSETLTSLELHWFDSWVASDFEQLFLHKMEHLELLKLTKWPLTDLVMATRVLTPSDEEFCRKEVKSLPCLQSLVLGADPYAHDTHESNDDLDNRLWSVYDLLPHHSDNHADDMIGLFLELLEKRRAGEFTPFCLDLPILWSEKHELTWSDSLRDKFRYAVEGRWIEVLQDGEVLEWL